MKNPEKKQACLEWLKKTPYIEVLSNLEEENDLIYQGFYDAFCERYPITEARLGTYSPLTWAQEATFVYGYILGMETAKRGSCQKWLADQQRKK